MCSIFIIDDGSIENTIKNEKKILLFLKTSENAGTISMANNNCIYYQSNKVGIFPLY